MSSQGSGASTEDSAVVLSPGKLELEGNNVSDGSYEDDPRPLAKMSFRERWRGFPLPVMGVFGSEFTERFSFYCMNTILLMYMLNVGGLDTQFSIIVTQGFGAFTLILTIFGSILSDGYLGKYHTILWLSVVHMFGSIALAICAVFPKGTWLHPSMDFVSLIVICIGAGGIKASVAPFGGDQFKKGQDHMLTSFFSVFYLMINFGAALSTIITPIIRVVFVSGTKWYTRIPADGNALWETIKCIYIAVVNKFGKAGQGINHSHWIEHRLDSHKCSDNQKCMDRGHCVEVRRVNDVRLFFRPLVIFAMMPFYWLIYTQAFQVWMIQSFAMTTKVSGSFHFLPDQMSFWNAFLIIVFVPIFSEGVYPLVEKMGIKLTPLRKMAVGGYLMVVPFAMAAYLQFLVEPQMAAQPAKNQGNLYIVNNFDCPMNFTANKLTVLVQSHNTGFLESVAQRATWDSAAFEVQHPISCSNPSLTNTNITITRKKDTFKRAAFMVFGPGSVTVMNKTRIIKTTSGEGHLTMGLTYSTSSPLPEFAGQFRWCQAGKGAHYCLSQLGLDDRITYGQWKHSSDWIDLEPGSWQLFYEKENQFKNDSVLVPTSANFTINGEGGIYLYALSGQGTDPTSITGTVLTIAQDNVVSILWQVPQYTILTISEVLYSVTGFEFSYSQAPKSMKSVMQAFYLLTMSISNFMFMGLTAADFIDVRSTMYYVVYAAFFFATMIGFSLIAQYWYVYNHISLGADEDEIELESIDEDNNSIHSKSNSIGKTKL